MRIKQSSKQRTTPDNLSKLCRGSIFPKEAERALLLFLFSIPLFREYNPR